MNLCLLFLIYMLESHMFKLVTFIACVSFNTFAGFEIRDKQSHIVNPIDIFSGSNPKYKEIRNMLHKEYAIYIKDGAVSPFKPGIFGTGMSKEMFDTLELPYFFTHENCLIPREVSNNIIGYNSDIFDLFYVAKWNAFASCIEKNPKIFSDPNLYILPIPNDLDNKKVGDNPENSSTADSDNLTTSDETESNRKLNLYLSNTQYTQDAVDILIKITKYLSVFAFKDFYIGGYTEQLQLQFNPKALNFSTLEIDNMAYSFPNFLSFTASSTSTNEIIFNINNTNKLMHDAFITFDQSTDMFSIFASAFKCIIKDNIVEIPNISAAIQIGCINKMQVGYISEVNTQIKDKSQIHAAFENIYKCNSCIYRYSATALC